VSVAEKEICEAAVRKYGLAKQMIKCVEELSELQKELCKQALGQGNLEHITEEIADVEIMLEQMKIGLNIGFYELTATKRKKLCRLSGNIETLEEILGNELKCRQCKYASMTQEEIDEIGIDPCDMCRDLCNWEPKEDLT